MRKDDRHFDWLLLQTTGQIAACAQATHGHLHDYYSETSCLLEAYSRATPLVVLPPSLRWGFRFGDTTRTYGALMEGAYLTKARKVGTRDQAVSRVKRIRLRGVNNRILLVDKKINK